MLGAEQHHARGGCSAGLDCGRDAEVCGQERGQDGGDGAELYPAGGGEDPVSDEDQ